MCPQKWEKRWLVREMVTLDHCPCPCSPSQNNIICREFLYIYNFLGERKNWRLGIQSPHQSVNIWVPDLIPSHGSTRRDKTTWVELETRGEDTDHRNWHVDLGCCSAFWSVRMPQWSDWLTPQCCRGHHLWEGLNFWLDFSENPDAFVDHFRDLETN